MGKVKRVVLPVLAGVLFTGYGVAIADKGGNGRNQAANPSVNLGFTAAPSANAQVGLPAGAVDASGKSRRASSAGLIPPEETKVLDRGAVASLGQLPTCR